MQIEAGEDVEGLSYLQSPCRRGCPQRLVDGVLDGVGAELGPGSGERRFVDIDQMLAHVEQYIRPSLRIPIPVTQRPSVMDQERATGSALSRILKDEPGGRPYRRE